MSTEKHKTLAQSRPANTNAVSAYSPSARIEAEIESIFICNTTGTAADASVFLDENGTTYDQSTAIIYATSVAANTSVEILGHVKLYMNDSAGNLAVQTGTNSALTFTVSGKEKQP